MIYLFRFRTSFLLSSSFFFVWSIGIFSYILQIQKYCIIHCEIILDKVERSKRNWRFDETILIIWQVKYQWVEDSFYRLFSFIYFSVYLFFFCFFENIQNRFPLMIFMIFMLQLLSLSISLSPTVFVRTSLKVRTLLHG